jgi:hypothetical protein
MLIRRNGWKPTLLVMDLTNEADLLKQDVVPGTDDSETLPAAISKVSRLTQRLPGLAIVASQDCVADTDLFRATGRTSPSGEE